jgi:cytochrome c5
MAMLLLLLIAGSYGLFLLVQLVSGIASEAYEVNSPVFQRELESRLAPFGTVAVTQEAAEGAGTLAEAAPEPVVEILSGPQVYNSACLACHGAGIGGAPKIGDSALWAPRIAQGMEIINAHVLDGYQGADGYMPPKGGRIDLSDEEILSAVTYMLDQSQ